MPTIPPRTPSDEIAHVEELLEHFERIEERFTQMQAGLTESHRLATLGTVAAMVAHEFNNILFTPMISYGQLALASPDDPQLMRKAVEKSLAGAEKAAHIVSSMLMFARGPEDTPGSAPGCAPGSDAEVLRASESSAADTSPGSAGNTLRANLRQTIADAFACLGREPAKDGIDLRIDVADDIDIAMCPVRLQQVLVNLILNAVQAMRQRQGVRRLSLTATESRGKCYLDVADTGPGIAPDLIESIFEPFVSHRPVEQENGRAGEQESRGGTGGAGGTGGTGTGLGLCICRDLVRHAGGQISASSTPGRGATFHLELPVAAKPEPHFETT